MYQIFSNKSYSLHDGTESLLMNEFLPEFHAEEVCYEESRFLGCFAMSTDKILLTFRKERAGFTFRDWVATQLQLINNITSYIYAIKLF
jgi:hypothetical protein